jgi:NADH-quinone oxidoreductase subunit N
MMIPNVDWRLIGQAGLPLWIVAGGGLLILLVSALNRPGSLKIPYLLLILLTCATIGLAWIAWLDCPPFASMMLVFDRLAFALDLVLLICLLLTLLFSRQPLVAQRLERGEYYSLLFFATFGGLLINHGQDLILIFIGIEIASLSTVILTGFRRNDPKSYEAALKYFILGSFASAFLLYGIALIYGATGSTSLKVLAGQASADSLLFLLALAFILVGLGFKIAAAPFHFWSPDVYEGAPTPITGFMASGIKTAGFAALIRLLIAWKSAVAIPWVELFWGLSALTMTVGNLMALRQTNIKRMLAYSSIAHAGYALVGLAAAMNDPTQLDQGMGAVLFYLLAYSLMTLGAFAVVTATGYSHENQEMSGYAGLAERRPVLSGVLTLFLLSLVGIPPTVGFVGKFFLFSSAIQAGLYGLVVIAVLNSAVSAWYYLAPVVRIYFQKGTGETQLLPKPLLIGIALCLFGVVWFGLSPSDLFTIAKESIRGVVF